MRLMALLIALLALSACATKMNNLRTGMTKQEAIAVMGTPSSTRADAQTEYLIYNLVVPGQGSRPHFVRIIDGTVDAYGMVGDFGSTQSPAATINVNKRTVE